MQGPQKINQQFSLKIKNSIGKIISITVNPTTTIQKVIERIHDQEGLPLHGIRLFAPGPPHHLEQAKTIADYHLNSQSIIKIQVRHLKDIGQFGLHEGSYGSEFLKQTHNNISAQKIDKLINSLGGNLQAFFETFSLGKQFQQKLDHLKQFADKQFEKNVEQCGLVEDGIQDFKINLTSRKLIQIIGSQMYEKLVSIFSSQFNQILIRRCQSHGKFINFHTDVSLKTLQVSINGEEDYEGGRLVYATQGQLMTPKRIKGTITVHNNSIVHGVSLLKSGVRYGLFLLKKQLNNVAK